MKSVIFPVAATAILVVLLSSCNDEQLPEQAAMHGETVVSPDSILSTALSSLLAAIGSYEHYTVTDIYAGDHHYRITYSVEEWHVEMPGSRNEPDSPELVHLGIDGCRLYLREGAVDLPTGVTIHKINLAGHTWGVHSAGARYPNHIVYTLGQPDKGIAFIIGLDWPREASAEIQQACQRAAEAVLDTSCRA